MRYSFIGVDPGICEREGRSLSLLSFPLPFLFPLPSLFFFLFFLPFPFFSFPYPSPFLSPSFSPSFLLEVGPLKPSNQSGRVLQASPVGSGAEPWPKSNLVHFSLKVWHLVATFLNYFSQNQLTKFSACSINNKSKQGWQI